MKTVLNFDIENKERYLGAALAAYEVALHAAVSRLADINGTDDLAWFDELHHQAVFASKGTITEEIPIEVEAGAIRFGTQLLDAKFKSLRIEMVEK